MIKLRKSDLVASSTQEGPIVRDGPRNELLRLLDLLREQVEAAGGLPIEHSPGAIPASDRWEDEDYCYFELDLARLVEAQVDINVSDGRAFIRLGR